METQAVLLERPKSLSLQGVQLRSPKRGDVVVDVRSSGISTGTEKLLYTGEMPRFPGLGYPLVPGYEAVGEVVDAPKGSGLAVGDTVFVPGSQSFEEARGLFGAAAARLISEPERLTKVDAGFGPEGALLALAATAYHAMVGPGRALPDLIVGHGVLGRLLARVAIALGGQPPVVWEIDPARMSGAQGYLVTHPAADPRQDYVSAYDASGQVSVIDDLVTRISRGGEVVIAGFYKEPLSIAFPPAFMKEAHFRIAAEWGPQDMAATVQLVESRQLSLSGLITHIRRPQDAAEAYQTAFDDPQCLKMILDWSGHDA
ncbi:MAG: chlorophyll synthesis pathway protein BchC [Pseudomonadota bacterium]